MHADQHSDLRKPDVWLSGPLENLALDEVFEYTQRELNVGNFIAPALRLGLFSDCRILSSEESLRQDIQESFVLDLDLDLFAESMMYLPREWTLGRVRGLLHRSAVVTIATSPYFIDQSQALQILSDLISGN